MSIPRVTILSSFIIAILIGSAQTSLGQYIDPNPVVVDPGKEYNLRYDPFSGRMRVDTYHGKLRESYFDPNRSNVDPGSYEQVNEYQTDENGVRWHVTGTRWTSGGRPHSNLTRTRATRWGKETEYVGSSVPNGQIVKPKAQTPARPSQPSKPDVWPGHRGPINPAQPKPTPIVWPGHSTNPVNPQVRPVRPTIPRNLNPVQDIFRAPQQWDNRSTAPRRNRNLDNPFLGS